jgi:hypothetical protein
MKKLYHILGYLKAQLNTKMVFNVMPVIPDMTLFEQQDWTFLPNGCEGFDEELTSNMPKLCGPSMTMRVFFDSNHAGDLITRHS